MTFVDIETALIAEIKAGMTSLKACESYAGQLEGDINLLPISYPAVFVSYDGSQLEWVDGPNYQETATFALLAISRNFSSREAQRTGDGGCYAIMNALLALLTNKTLGLPMQKLRPTKVSLVYTSKTIAAYAVEFQTEFDTNYGNW